MGLGLYPDPFLVFKPMIRFRKIFLEMLKSEPLILSSFTNLNAPL
jgi:hypothetical protein